MEYNPREIEPKWQSYWQQHAVYKVENNYTKPKYYVLDMFPYPSGAGLHIGHPLGYVATDIFARYKRLKGFNVLHPMGFDSFGLPAEQYAIETGQHPALTTDENIRTFKDQLSRIGFDHDWAREVQTSDPKFYIWTQWIFQQIFQSWYNLKSDKAEDIQTLMAEFEKSGNQTVQAVCDEDTPLFSASDWNAFSEKEKWEILLKYRLTYVADSTVNWCPALGTVLANDEIKDGLSERGGHPVERKKMRQWMMRITAYAEKLLAGLENVDWSEALKEMQRNWIGKSHGAEAGFKVVDKDITLTCFTTRPDTIFGVTFVVIAPEHELIPQLTTPDQKAAVEAYVEVAKNRSELERQSEVKRVSGVFTGSYVINPISQEKIPLWIADYVLAGYGTGVVMAVPGGDERDFRFAQHFNLPILPVVASTLLDENGEVLEANPTKDDVMINSGFLNGMTCREAIQAVNTRLEALGLGKGKINYRLRDAVFSRQRYWGEPVPVFFKDGLPYLVPSEELPLTLPAIDEYRPTETGEPPLGRALDWKYQQEYDYELTTMPGWAGSSWYSLRYMDPENPHVFADREAINYWDQVDLYIGGTEHAVGHLLYSRFWNHFLFDRGYISNPEPFKKLINQGMIQGESAIIYRAKDGHTYISASKIDNYEVSEIHISINTLSDNETVDLEKLKAWRPDEFEEAEFVLDDEGKFLCIRRHEKMGKRYHNAVNPNDVVAQYGADTMRLYLMFLGPLEQSKPWNTQGIDGTAKFLKKLWRLFYDDKGNYLVNEDSPKPAELKILHKTIKMVEEDLDRYAFNTPVSKFMVCVNELGSLKCHKKAVLEKLLIILAPYAPHITEELWAKIGHTDSIHHEHFPDWNEEYIKEEEVDYPIMINGKKRGNILFAVNANPKDVEKAVLESDVLKKWSNGKTPKKIIVVPNKIVNVVL
ncbi:MAG: leucine--tRNA ligase [Microscillaceae bacterium]|nr:leucine--tRNA ligase [Microscillaceae bacterium]